MASHIKKSGSNKSRGLLGLGSAPYLIYGGSGLDISKFPPQRVPCRDSPGEDGFLLFMDIFIHIIVDSEERNGKRMSFWSFIRYVGA